MAELFRFTHVPAAVMAATGLPRRFAGEALPLLDDRDRELEDYLSRLPAGAGGPSVAWLNNSAGDIGGSGGDFQQWDQLATSGDTDWFEFPTDYWGPDDRAAFRFMQPGIFTVVARVTGSGLASVEVTAGGNGTIAEGTTEGESLCGSGMFIAEQVEPTDYEVLLIETTGADPVFSQVAICYWPGEPVFTQF